MAPENSQSPETLARILAIGCWFPAFGFGLAHGIVTEQAPIAILIIPATFSALFCIACLASANKTSRGATWLVDLVLAITQICFLAPAWHVLSHDYDNDAPLVMVGTYATVGPMLALYVSDLF